jgi:predicted acetyltransferase
MSYEVRRATDDRLADVLRAVEMAFGEEVSDHEVETKRRTIEIDRVIYIEDEGDIVAGGGAYTFKATVPGNVLPTAGVTLIGVKPSHRRRGLLRAMMEQQLDDIHGRGEPIAMLWASEGAIYGRFGYGLASVQSWLDIESDRGVFVNDPGPRGRVRLLPLEEALGTVRPIYDRAQSRTPGMFERTDAWWERRVLADPKEWREGASPKYLAVWEEDGSPRAYAFYRIETGWSHAGPIGHVQLWELLADDDIALREMWRYVFGIDLVDRVKSRTSMLPADSPLYLMLLEPRRLRSTFSDGLWLRVVDVRSALEGRGFAADGEITIEVADDMCSWNQGRWRIAARDGRAQVERTDRDAELTLDASTLGAAYLGTFTFAQLRNAGRVFAHSEKAVRLADSMFRTDIAPYCPEIF